MHLQNMKVGEGIVVGKGMNTERRDREGNTEGTYC